MFRRKLLSINSLPTYSFIVCFTLLLGSCQEAAGPSKSESLAADSGTPTVDSELPACTQPNGPQVDLWERLGSPIPASGDAHVAPSLLVVEDELWLYYAERENMVDNIYLLRSSDGTSWSEPQAIETTGCCHGDNIH